MKKVTKEVVVNCFSTWIFPLLLVLTVFIESYLKLEEFERVLVKSPSNNLSPTFIDMKHRGFVEKSSLSWSKVILG